MNRRVVVTLAAALLVLSAVGAFAYEQKSRTYSWMASYDRTGQLNIYASVGFYYVGYEIGGGPEFILGNFNISGVPFEWGLMARALLGFGSFAGYANWFDWGVAPMVTLHWGNDFGQGLRFEWYGGLGLGIFGTTGTYFTDHAGFPSGYGPFLGFAGAGGFAWHFADNFALIADYSYVGLTSNFGIGLKISL